MTIKHKTMNTAKPTDWKTKPLPSTKATIHLERTFSSREMERIRAGLVPQQMEDKWFIYWENDALFFHRSWTGVCIYVVRFTAEGDGGKMIGADVNREPEQYGETSDKKDAKMISYLVDVLLLRHPAEFPSDEASDENRALKNWSQIGRAMLGEDPDDE